MEIKDSIKELNEFIKLKLNEIIKLIECENCGDDFTESLKLGSVEQELKNLKGYVEREKDRISKLIQEETPNDLSEEKDDLFQKAVVFALTKGEISVAMLQREFFIGYSRALQMLETMEKRGYISKGNNCPKRQVLVTAEDLKENK